MTSNTRANRESPGASDSMACRLCASTTFLMFTVAGSKRTGAANEVLCHLCHRRYVRHEVDLPVRKMEVQ